MLYKLSESITLHEYESEVIVLDTNQGQYYGMHGIHRVILLLLKVSWYTFEEMEQFLLTNSNLCKNEINSMLKQGIEDLLKLDLIKNES